MSVSRVRENRMHGSMGGRRMTHPGSPAARPPLYPTYDLSAKRHELSWMQELMCLRLFIAPVRFSAVGSQRVGTEVSVRRQVREGVFESSTSGYWIASTRQRNRFHDQWWVIKARIAEPLLDLLQAFQCGVRIAAADGDHRLDPNRLVDASPPLRDQPELDSLIDHALQDFGRA